MDKEREQSYRHLISGVLTYPNRSALILDANQHLLDAGLMQVMEQVATSMAANSSTEAASFLQNLVAQLKDELMAATVKKASLLEGQKIEIDEVDNRPLQKSQFNQGIIRVSGSLLEMSNEEEWSKWGGLAILLGNILFVVMVVL